LREGLLQDIERYRARYLRAFERTFEHRMQYLDGLARRVISPRQRLRQQHECLQQLALRLKAGFAALFRDRRIPCQILAARVALLSPQRTLSRGYAALLSLEDGHALRAPSELTPGHSVLVHLAEGRATMDIDKVRQILPPIFT
jgi:exodeoxyribonuclease VII large subunit